MMDKKKYILLCIFSWVMLAAPYAQLGGGIKATGSYFLAKKDYKILSFGAFISYDFDISQSIRVGYMYGLKYNFSLVHNAYANDPSIQPNKREITQEVQLNNFSIFAEYQKYLSDMSDKESGLYALVGLGILSSSAISTYTNTDANYTIPDYELITEKERFNQMVIRASLGFDVKISVIKWYLEAGIGMPGTTTEQKTVNHAYLPGYLEISTGIKF